MRPFPILGELLCLSMVLAAPAMPAHGANCAWLATQTPGAAVLSESPPLGLTDMTLSEDHLSLTWQGESNMTLAIETADGLDPLGMFAPYRTGLISSQELNACTLPRSPDASCFYRVVEDPSGVTNPAGRVVVFSDLHMSPFASASITTGLLEAAVSEWDGILSSDTNGYCSVDATGKRTCNPLLWQSALANGQAACPSPDAVLLLGDFEYYDYKHYYQQITGDASEANWKQLLGKQYEYILAKTAQAFPGIPIYPCLGNNDTYTNDYEIAVGDEFLRDTAPLFHEAGLTGVVSYADFAATFTNAGCYSAPFGQGQIVAVESVFLSSLYASDTAPGSNQLAYLSDRLAACEAQGRPAWVLSHIPPGINAYDTWSHWQTGDVSYVGTNWREDFLNPFNKIVAQYQDTIGSILSGHYHLRAWQMANDPATSNATDAIHIMGAMLDNHGNNPAFTVLIYNRQTLEILREATYALPKPVYSHKTGPATWSTIYNMNRGYQLPDLAAGSLLTAWSNMAAAGSAGFDFFRAQYNCGLAPYVQDATNWPVYRGELRWINPEQFLDNVPLP
ncbi:MAG: metallophosphoesterase [Lentisphaerota bacterium]